MRRCAAGLMLAVALVGCEAEQDRFQRSCAGEPVLECRPHLYSVVRSASLMPERIEPLAAGTRARFRVEVDTCAAIRDPIAVQVFAVVTHAGSDAGVGGERVIDLGITLRDDGTDGDAAAGDGVIEQETGNPFEREIPGDRDITLRFVPLRPGCQGDPLEITYRTGRSPIGG